MEPQPLIIEQERIDDVPLLLGMMRRMQIAETLDQHLRQHHLHQGLSNGNLALGWIAYLLSESDHRKSAVQEWAHGRMALSVITHTRPVSWHNCQQLNISTVSDGRLDSP